MHNARNMFVSVCALATMIFVASRAGLCGQLFVSPAGSDLGIGTEADPWRTLQRAADAVVAGDTVTVLAGSYAGFDLSTSGNAASPIRFMAEPGVLIDAPNSRTPDGINLEGASYIVIDGFEVVGMPRAGIRSVVNHHVTIRDNRVDQSGRWGIFSGFSNDLLVENNETSRSQAEHGIYVSNSGDRPTIRQNLVWGNAAAGIHMNGDASQGGDGIISEALVEQNIIFDNGQAGGSGINADGVQQSVFQNNLLYENHASGISLYRIDGAAGSIDNLIVNNTIVQATDARWALNIQNGSTGNTVLNNILFNHHPVRGSIDISADSLSGLTSNFNAVMERFTTDGGDSVLDLAGWRSATGQDLNSFVSAPAALFVDSVLGDYQLAATSPAIGTGTSSQAPTIDLERKPRPLGGSVDIGAFEFYLPGDGNDDGSVGPADYTIWVNGFGMSVSAPSSSPDAVPEPSTFVLATVGIIGLSCCCRRRRREFTNAS